jgi:UDP-glucose 4-epimerase
VAAGWAVRGIARTRPVLPLDAPCDLVLGDVAAPGVVAAAAPGCDAVVHLAGWVHRIPRRPSEELELRRSIVEGSRLTTNAAATVGARLVLGSSVAVYGSASLPAERDEGWGPAPDTPYGRAKLEAEGLVRAILPEACVLRFALVYGPHDRGNFLSLVRAIHHRRAVVVGRGLNRKSLVYSENLADRVMAALSRPAGDVAGTWIVADGAPRQRELMEIIARHLARRRPARLPELPLRFALTAVDLLVRTVGRSPRLAERAGKLSAWNEFSGRALDRCLGYRPRVDLEEGVRRVVAHHLGV